MSEKYFTLDSCIHIFICTYLFILSKCNNVNIEDSFLVTMLHTCKVKQNIKLNKIELNNPRNLISCCFYLHFSFRMVNNLEFCTKDEYVHIKKIMQTNIS